MSKHSIFRFKLSEQCIYFSTIYFFWDQKTTTPIFTCLPTNYLVINVVEMLYSVKDNVHFFESSYDRKWKARKDGEIMTNVWQLQDRIICIALKMFFKQTENVWVFLNK